VLTGGDDDAGLWDVQSRRKSSAFLGHPGADHERGLSGDGRFASRSHDQTLCALWDVRRAAKEVRSFAVPRGQGPLRRLYGGRPGRLSGALRHDGAASGRPGGDRARLRPVRPATGTGVPAVPDGKPR